MYLFFGVRAPKPLCCRLTRRRLAILAGLRDLVRQQSIKPHTHCFTIVISSKSQLRPRSDKDLPVPELHVPCLNSQVISVRVMPILLHQHTCMVVPTDQPMENPPELWMIYRAG